MAGLVVPESYWQALSLIYSGGGGRDAVVNSAGRSTNFFAPYATEFFAIWSDVNPTVAMNEIGVQAAQLAQMGVNVVKLWYPFNAWKYWNSGDVPNGTSTSLRLSDVLQVFGNNGIQVIVLMGNATGSGVLASSPGVTGAFYQKTNSGPLPLPGTPNQWMLLVDRNATAFHTTPGDDYLEQLDPGQFASFMSTAAPLGDWTNYVDHVLGAGNAQFSTILALELWNEPEQSISDGPNAYARTAQLIEHIRVRGGSTWAQKLMIGVGYPAYTELFFTLSPYLGPNWLTDHVRYYGFHPAAAHRHTGGAYNEGGRKYPAWPPSPPGPLHNVVIPALYDTQVPGFASAQQEFSAFMTLHNGTRAVLEELAVREAFFQFLSDVDRAFQVQATGESTMDLGPWSAVPTRYMTSNTVLADGTARVPSDVLALQNRWRMGTSMHGAGSFDGSFNGLGPGPVGAKVHPPPGAPAVSRALRPLVLDSPRDVASAGLHESTLLVYSDAYDDVPTQCQYQHYPPTTRPNERHRIWLRGFFKQGGGGFHRDSGVVALDSLVGQGLATWARLSEDPAFRDVDDNLAKTGWSSVMPPLRMTEFDLPDRAYGLWAANVLTAPNANGYFISRDDTWGLIDGSTFKIPIPSIPCSAQAGWAGFIASIPGQERELLVREPIVRMVRGNYAGVSGRISGTFRLAEGDDGSESLTHHYTLAFHRLVWKHASLSEHFGPGEDARSTSVTLARAWSANYGDFFFNNKREGFATAVHPPSKMEVVVVDVRLQLLPDGTLKLQADTSILPTTGDHGDGEVTGRGAEAWDPVVAAAPDGTLVVAYRKAQDPYFEFQDPPEGTGLWLGTELASTGGSYSECGGPYLPLPHPTDPLLKKRRQWVSFLQSMKFWMFPRDLFVRLRTPGTPSTWSTEVRLSEPAFPDSNPSNFRLETWSSWLSDLRNLEDRNSILAQMKTASVEKHFHEGWLNAGTPQLHGANGHTWNPALNPSLLVGARTGGGELPIGVAWGQYPKDLRKLPGAEATAYAVRGLRLRFDSGNNLIPSASSPAYADFTSDTILGVANHAAVPVRIANSLRGPVGFVLRPVPQGSSWVPDAEMRCFFQMGTSLYGAREGQTSGLVQDAFSSGTVRVRSVHAATAPVVASLPGGGSELELAAWIQPEGAPGSKKQRIAYHAALPRQGASPGWDSGIQQIPSQISPTLVLYETVDPYAAVIGVFPHVSGTGASTKGRIVWKADGTLWWADVQWGASPATGLTVLLPLRRANTAVPGPFPARETEVVASPSALVWTHDGSVLSLKFP